MCHESRCDVHLEALIGALGKAEKTCPACGERLHVRAVVTEPETAAKILESLARTRAPPRAA